jgi:hypothetical protein
MTITEPDENVQNVSGLNQLYQIQTMQRTNGVKPTLMITNLLRTITVLILEILNIQ